MRYAFGAAQFVLFGPKRRHEIGLLRVIDWVHWVGNEPSTDIV